MGASSQNENDDAIVGINITPMVDIVLVLLIIFMVTTSVIVNQSIRVDLPKAANADESPQTTFALVLTTKGELFLNGKLIEERDLHEIIPARLAEDSDLKAIISADKECKHGDVIHLIDVIKGLGITKFALNIERVSVDEFERENSPAP